jgi:DNA-binding LacI/PurR family transcriptional regulator
VAVSIKTVAERVGVSEATISRVLNNKPGFQASEDTRKKIHNAVAELGYVGNKMARSLGKGRSETIGVIVDCLTNPYFAMLVESTATLSAAAGYHALVEITPSVGSASGRVGQLSGWPVDGMLVWTNHWTILQDASGNAYKDSPIVYLGYPRTDGTDWVASDLYDGGRQITEHVYDTGRKNVWYLTPYDFDIPVRSEMRMRAYTDVTKERGFQDHVIATPRCEESTDVGVAVGQQIAAMPKSERPDALVVQNDLIAIGVYRGLRDAGLRVPEDIALTGFDGTLEGQNLERPLTTLSTPPQEMARVALEILFSRIAGNDAGPIGRMLKGTLLVGKTT